MQDHSTHRFRRVGEILNRTTSIHGEATDFNAEFFLHEVLSDQTDTEYPVYHDSYSKTVLKEKALSWTLATVLFDVSRGEVTVWAGGTPGFEASKVGVFRVWPEFQFSTDRSVPFSSGDEVVTV